MRSSLRRSPRLVLLALLVAGVLVASVLVAACDARRASSERSGSLSRSSPLAPASPPVTSSGPPSPAETPLACATLRDVSASDVVRLAGSTLFYADATAGLTLVDVGDARHPRVLSVLPFVGTPVALFLREGIAWVVFIDWDSRSGVRGPATVIRAVDVRDPSAPRTLGTEVREGTARDAKLVGGLLYVLRRATSRSVVESFGLKEGALRRLDGVEVDGIPAQLAASSAGLAVATDSDDHVTLAWVDLSMERPGSLALRAPLRLPGGVATAERGDGRVIDADDGQRVRLVTCATQVCAANEPATLRIVDFSAEDPASSLTSLRLTERGGLPVTRFADSVLYVAESTPGTPDPTSTLHVVHTEEPVPRAVAHLPLRGRLDALALHDATLVALGTVGSPESQVKIILHDLDVEQPAAPRPRSSVTFGSDWTWTIVDDDEKAISFDPGSRLVAFPFTAWRRKDKRILVGAQLVDLGQLAAQSGGTLGMDSYVERAVFLDGQLVTIGPKGVTSIDYASTRRSDLTERGFGRPR